MAFRLLCIPQFICREFEDYLDCGILENGFVRVYCFQCRHEKLVAFSCKKRGFCPSCTARRMNDLAFHIVNKVLPGKVDIRQWVLSMPYAVMFVLAHDQKNTTKVLKIFTRTVSAWMKNKARGELNISAKKLQTGAVTFIQRFGSGLNLNIHFHTIFCDGVFYEHEGAWKWHKTLAPSINELQLLAVKLKLKIHKYLQKKNLLTEEGYGELHLDDQNLNDITDASIHHKSAFDSTEQRKYGYKRLMAVTKISKSGGASISGYSLHAGVWLKGHQQGKIEKLLRYMARGPLAVDRLSKSLDGNLIYTLKSPWDDGERVIKSISFTPLQLIERLAAIIPPPNKNLVIYFGVLAPRL